MNSPTAEVRAPATPTPAVVARALEVVVCGSYRRGTESLRADVEELRSHGCRILSPVSTNFVDEIDGFVFAAGQEGMSPRELELAHLASIEGAEFVWLHAPDGYVGLSGSMEVGFAHSLGIPIYCRERPTDITLQEFVTVVDSIGDVVQQARKPLDTPPVRALATLQVYYRRACEERGYSVESARDCLLLLTEEVGELARAVRKSAGLAREGGYGDESVAHEIADVALYLLHLANVTGVELARALTNKEAVNASRFISRSRTTS